jgi:hypothetical protein
MAMDVKDKQRAVIEFLLLKGCTGDKIVVHLQNVYGSAAYCRASVFKRISEVRAATKNFETKDPLENPIGTKQMRRFGQFYNKTQIPR